MDPPVPAGFGGVCDPGAPAPGRGFADNLTGWLTFLHGKIGMRG